MARNTPGPGLRGNHYFAATYYLSISQYTVATHYLSILSAGSKSSPPVAVASGRWGEGGGCSRETASLEETLAVAEPSSIPGLGTGAPLDVNRPSAAAGRFSSTDMLWLIHELPLPPYLYL